MPASSSARTMSTRRTPSRMAAVTTSASSSNAGSPPTNGAMRRGGAAPARPPTASFTSTRWSPISRFSSSGVPWATVRPWSSTTMSSARRSASSRYWVVSTRVVPLRTRSRSISHRSPRLRGSSPVVGSSRNSTSGSATRLARQVEPAAHAAAERLHQLVAGVGEVEPLEQLVAAPAGLGLRQAVQAADHLEVQPGGHQPVDRGLLGGDTDAPAHLVAGLHHVEAGHRGRPLRRLRQRGEDADGRGLAGAVVAEQAEHLTGRHVEVEVAQRPQVAELLAQAAGSDATGGVEGDGGCRLNLIRMLYRSFVHSTTNVSSTLYDMATEYPKKSPASSASPRSRPSTSPPRRSTPSCRPRPTSSSRRRRRRPTTRWPRPPRRSTSPPRS